VLTADLVRARVAKGRLQLSALPAAQRSRALGFAASYLELARSATGDRREDLLRDFEAVGPEARDRRVAAGLVKLVLDRCEFEAPGDQDPVELRRQLFTLAAQRRREQDEEHGFQRDLLLAELGARLGIPADGLPSLLYADRKDQHRLVEFRACSPEHLLEEYEQGQAQAVLLRATSLLLELGPAPASSYRPLFARLKFLGLLHEIEPLPPQGDGDEAGSRYRVRIDGPYSLFTASTRYGLQLALLLPTLRRCPNWRLQAKLLWGAQRQALDFELSHDQATPRSDGGEASPLRPEVAQLLAALEARQAEWRVAPAQELLDLPGLGLCLPDLRFDHPSWPEPVYLEVMGFWSRAAVWRRVELVESGLAARVLFAVSQRLRVSEEVLDPDAAGALYVYKGVPSARQVAQRVEQLAARPTGARAPRPAPGRARKH